MHELIWWRRPRPLAALGCVAVGLAMLVAGPAMRAAWSPAVPVVPVAELAEFDLLDAPPADATALRLEAAPETVADSELVVYVSGAVAKPDVYLLPAGARVKDAVVAAGGLRDDAASDAINLAEPLQDAQHVHVPRQADALAVLPAANLVETGGETGGLLELNSASAAELEELPGIGKTLAERIVARREQEGPYRVVDDLRTVSGIGEKLFAQISPLVAVGP